MQFVKKMHPQKMGFRDYIEALEEERRKIQVFPKELPLSLELVTQAIEACRQQLSGTVAEYNLNGQSECSNLNGQSECSEQTSTDDGPVFEEFIPIKKSVPQDSVEEEEEEDEDDDEQHSHEHNNRNSTTDKKKSDWLRSVQLWNPNPPPSKEDVPRKTNVVEVKRNGGAFQPFHREEKSGVEKKASAIGKVPSSPPVPATSSTGPGKVESKKEEKGQAHRKQRRCWSQELHKRFLHALQQLGGADSATPKQIRELMKVDGLTNDEVKSHLQKFRLHTRRSPMIHNNASSQTGAPLFLVGNIFVQPPEYGAAVATTSTASGGELTTVTTTAPSGIYAPVASHPPPIMKPRFNQLQVSQHSHNNNCQERANHSVHSNSPASSSSTHTITTSPTP